MIHLPNLIIDLGLILGAAGIITLLFKKLRQPLVLGYIIAGLLVGPNFPLFPTVSDGDSIKIWAEIGVIFLLFSLGLEFSFKKLVKVGGPASVTALIEIGFMLLVGYLTGQVLGWSVMDSIFLGGILSVSSTTIIIRAFEELGVKSRKFAGMVFGVLIVEDLVAILLLVLLSTLALSREFEGMEMLFSVGKLIIFLVLWFLGGIFLLPTFLKRVKHLMNDETMLIISIALCLMMVVLATMVGFSPALGAFIMGSILAETTYAEKIEHMIKSVKDLFAAVFFVSVGMLIDPYMLWEYLGPILLITLVTIVGKTFSTALGSALSGQSLKTSVQAGMSLAQIGEFSFIIATLGLTLKVTSDFLYPIAVAVSAITTFTTPYLIRLSEPAYRQLEKRLPASWNNWLSRYSASAQAISVVSDWKLILRSYIIVIVLHSVIIIAIIVSSSIFLGPFIKLHIASEAWGNFLAAFVTLIIMAPFLWALAGRKINRAQGNFWLNSKYNRSPLISMEFLRLALAIFFIGLLIDKFYSALIAFIIAIPVTLLVLFILSKRLQFFYNLLEKRFLTNLNEREAQMNLKTNLNIAPWDAHLTDFEVDTGSLLMGKTLQELALREKYGVNIALIERGKELIAIPGRDERLFPGDKLSVIGTDEQLQRFRAAIEMPDNVEEFLVQKPDILLRRVFIAKNSPLINKSIRESAIREKKQGLVVGIEREGQRMLNPDSKEIFMEGDIVWIVGSKESMSSLISIFSGK